MSILIQQEMQPDSALIHIKKSYVRIITVNDESTVESKDVLHGDFMKILSSSMRSTLIDDGKFDQFIIGNNIIKFKASTDGFVYYFLARKGKYPYNNEGRVRMIHYPNMIFKFVLDPERNLRKTKLAIIKDGDIFERVSFGVSSLMIKPNAKLYRYMLGNVGSDGNVCWGGNTFESLDTYNSLIETVSTFFSSPSNNDFVNFDPESNLDRKTLLSTLETNAFDENILEEMTYTFEKY